MPDANIQHFHDAPTGTLSYVVADPLTSKAAVIDPVLGFSVVSGRTDTNQADVICQYLEDNKLELEWILETHAHADHLSAAQTLKSRLGGKVAIGGGIRKVQEHFASLFNLKAPFRSDGSQFDQLFSDGQVFRIGSIDCRVIATPGHTSDSVTYLAGSAAFVGDTLFMPDYGTARCDFPGGDAGLLYDSIQTLFALPDDTTYYMCHDYPPQGRELRYCVSISEQRKSNIHIGAGRSRKDFVAMRQARDSTLSLPSLILPAIQINIRAGHLPAVEDNSVSYLKIPLDQL
ncbi:MAG: MBL fold metallo-hydrolase [Gammaproteobacteria bacterium]|nr:MBL fold metallo-hydrolase [Gammaproteobacteria bacterium]MDH4314579.1 MBL fold metallo-hydrolase [Gammaproteobacteria bacterium]MDH5214843.1 MBL fold metallo-hydrolase [Gammaproteobacteria bacterium]